MVVHVLQNNVRSPISFYFIAYMPVNYLGGMWIFSVALLFNTPLVLATTLLPLHWC